MKKKCLKCKRKKDIIEFSIDNSRRDGHCDKCKKCCNYFSKKYALNNKEKIKEYTKKYALNNKEKIKEKGKKYRLNNKEKIRKYARKYRLNNKEKFNERNKKYRLKNKEKIKEKAKKYRLNNKEKIKEIGRQYYLNNKEKIIEKTQQYYFNNKEKRKKYCLKNKARYIEYAKRYYLNNKKKLIKYGLEKYQNDLNHRVAHILRSRIRLALKGCSKSQHMRDVLGCDILEFKNYLEKQFANKMSWDNYGKGIGKWNIDHIIPCAIFDFTDPSEQKQCFHFSNLRPLWERGPGGNFEKSDTIRGLKLLYNNDTSFK